MGIYIRITSKSMIDAIKSVRDTQEVVTDKSILELCPKAHSIYYRAGIPIGYLIPWSEEEVEGLRLTEERVPRFGKFYDLYEPNRRTLLGKKIHTCLECLQNSILIVGYALDLIGPKIKSKLVIDEFGFDYRTQARLHFVCDEIFMGIVGISVLHQVLDDDSGIQLVSRDAYRIAVKTAQAGAPKLLFSDDDSLVARAKASLDPFIELDNATVNSLLSDIYQRVCSEPKDVKNYIPQIHVEREQAYVFATLVGILHAFYGVE